MEGLAALAYEDAPLPIGRGQVTTQPSLTAMMLEALALTGGETVLEVGTGHGYQTALLAPARGAGPSARGDRGDGPLRAVARRHAAALSGTSAYSRKNSHQTRR